MAGIAMLLLCSCDAENSISTKYPCQFYFKSQYHPGTSLETALNGTGVYTMVSAKKVNGAWNIYSTLNDGKTRRKPSFSLPPRRIMPTIPIWERATTLKMPERTASSWDLQTSADL